MKTLRGAAVGNGLARVEQYKGKEYMVVPVVGLVEGLVHAMNARGPELVLAEEFSKNLEAWTGRPVYLGHPLVNGRPVFSNSDLIQRLSFGEVRNAQIKNGKLIMEAWIDLELAATRAPEILTRARANESIEISIGAGVSTEETKGVHSNGRPYVGIWRDISPDHLALLPGDVAGACSFDMGCGVRAASEGAKFCWPDQAGNDDHGRAGAAHEAAANAHAAAAGNAKAAAVADALTREAQSLSQKAGNEKANGYAHAAGQASFAGQHDAAAKAHMEAARQHGKARYMASNDHAKAATAHETAAAAHENAARTHETASVNGSFGGSMAAHAASNQANAETTRANDATNYANQTTTAPGTTSMSGDAQHATGRASVAQSASEAAAAHRDAATAHHQAARLHRSYRGAQEEKVEQDEKKPKAAGGFQKILSAFAKALGVEPSEEAVSKHVNEMEAEMTKCELEKLLANATPEQLKAAAAAMKPPTAEEIKAAADAKTAAEKKDADEKAAAALKVASDKKDAAIVAVKATGKNDRTDEALKAMSQEQLDEMLKALSAPKAPTFEELLAHAPGDVRAAINAGVDAAKAKKAAAIKTLQDSKRCDLTTEQLNAKTQTELDALVKLAGSPAVDNSGRGMPRVAGQETTAPAAPDFNAAVRAAAKK